MNRSVSAADPGEAAPIAATEARSLFADLADAPVLVLAVSGGPDSTALMWLAARWRRARRRGPRLVAVTVDHGLRPESGQEAQEVARLARTLGIEHRTLVWRGRKPRTGLQDAARQARYRLLGQAASLVGAGHVLTAHTLDDQAETVLIRLARGSGIAGLAAMRRVSPLPFAGAPAELVRPLIDVPKARLLATLRAARLPYADDPSNRDPRFTRARLRQLMPALASEGLTGERLAQLARRAQRVELALDALVDHAAQALSPVPWSSRGPIRLAADGFSILPAEVALRLLGHVVGQVGDEGPVELGKLEALYDDLRQAPAGGRFRRTLAGALVTLARDSLTVERAPARRARRRAGPP